MRLSKPSYLLGSEWHPDKPGAVDQLSSILVEIQQRLDTVQQIGTKTPPAPTSPVATGKQGCIWLTWQRIANVDGYIVLSGSESTMTKLVGRHNLPDSESCTFQLPVGNSATQYFFQVFAYRGNQISPPSPTVNATSIAFGSGESAPPNPPSDPRNTKLAGITGGAQKK